MKTKRRKQYPYSKKPEVGKAIVARRFQHFRVHTIDSVSENGYASTPFNDSYYQTYDEANEVACKMNDWQNIKPEDVYKPINRDFVTAYQHEPWMHIYLYKDKMIFFIWDTRQIVRIAKNPFENWKPEDISKYLTKAIDNLKPLVDNDKWLFRSEIEKLKINYRTPKESTSVESFF